MGCPKLSRECVVRRSGGLDVHSPQAADVRVLGRTAKWPSVFPNFGHTCEPSILFLCPMHCLSGSMPIESQVGTSVLSS